MSDGNPLPDLVGNAPDIVKQVLYPSRFFNGRLRPKQIFAEGVLGRLKLKEIWIQPKADEPEKEEARVIFELDSVQDDMLNVSGNVHGGCWAFLVDISTSLAIAVLPVAKTGTAPKTVSQNLNIMYHSPARAGDVLRIVCTSVAIGARASTCRAEIYNVTHHRLAVSGVHVMMQPSQPKPKL